MPKRLAFTLTLALLSGIPAVAQAQTEPAPPPEDPPAPSPAPAPAPAPALPVDEPTKEEDADAWKTRARVHPSDDGEQNPADPSRARPVDGEDGIEPEDIGLALPRLILAPPRIALNIAYLPVRGILHVLGRYQIVEHVIDILYNDERTAAILPSFSFLGSQGVTVGATAFHGGWGKHDEKVSVSAKFGGEFVQRYELEFTAPRVAGTLLSLDVSTRFEMQPRLRFYGYGPGKIDQDLPEEPGGLRATNVQTRYRQRRGIILFRPGFRLTDEIDLGVQGTFNTRAFDADIDESETDPAIDEVYDTARIPGFDDGYSLAEGLLDFRVDNRFPRAFTNKGVYFNAFVGGAPPQHGYKFLRYGAEFTGYIDIYHGDRVLALHAAHESVYGEDNEIPFAEMPRLGGPRRLRGYDKDRFRDKNTLLLSAEYHYPISDLVQGVVFFEAGSVGRDYEQLFTPDSYKFGGGGGLHFQYHDKSLFNIQAAYGEGFEFFVTTDPLVSFSKKGEQL